MRAAVGGALAVFLAGCATVRPSAPPPVRDGTLARAEEARPEPVPGRIDGPVPAPEWMPVPPDVSGPRPAEPPRPAFLDEGRPEEVVPSIPGEAVPGEVAPGEGIPGAGAPQAGNSAVVALLESAREAEGAREYGRAAAALERALKVDARDPWLWHRLAAIRFRQGRHAEAEALALRSLSLRRAGRDLDTMNWRVIAAARRVQGDEEGAREAIRRANSP